MKKFYKKPISGVDIAHVGFPTMLAIGIASAAVGAASVAVGKMVGSILPIESSATAFLVNDRLIIKGTFA